VTSHRRGVALVAGAAALWSIGGLAIKFLQVPPLAIVFHRAWIASVTLIVLLRPPRIRLSATFLGACLAYAGMVISFVVATKWTTAANAIFLQDSGIVWVLLFSPLVAREPIVRRDALAVAACLAGMALFFVGRLSLQAQAGNAVALASGLCYAATILLLRRQRGAASEWTAIGGNVLAAALVLPFLERPFSLSAASWGILALLGVVQIGFAYALFVRGLNRISAAEASIVALLEPILNPVWVFLGIGERPTGFAIVGALVVVATIAWRTLSTGRPVSGGIPNPD
jgi:DME family drug/metabolite transporter